MKKVYFPTYKSHAAAKAAGCFSCPTKLFDEEYWDAGYADGNGRFAIRCPQCGFITFYDVEQKGE